MFLENASQKGWIEVICGSMFSGKTEELIRRLKRAEFARLRVEIFKPRIDVRYSEEEVVSHDASAIRSTPVDSAQNILLMTSDVDVVGIDEAQFFDQGLVEVGRQRGAGNRGGPRHGLHGQALRTDAGADGYGGVRNQSTRHLRTVRQPGAPFAPPDQRRETGDARCAGLLRTDLSPLFRRTAEKRAGIKGICPLKIRTFSGPYASEAYNSIRQSPLAEGIVLRINETEKSVSGISKRQKKQRILRTRRRIYSTSADSA